VPVLIMISLVRVLRDVLILKPDSYEVW